MRNHFRRGARFIADARQHCRPYSKGEINSYIKKAEVLDAFSKKFGSRMGLIGDSGMKVLRALLEGFLDWKTGACFPRIRAIMQKTRYARSTVCEALRRLQHVGIVKWVQRRQWKHIWRNGRAFMAEVQTSNAYSFSPPRADAHQLPILKRSRVRALVGSVAKSLSPNGFVSGSGKHTEGTPPVISLSGKVGFQWAAAPSAAIPARCGAPARCGHEPTSGIYSGAVALEARDKLASADALAGYRLQRRASFLAACASSNGAPGGRDADRRVGCGRKFG